jgi:hypothetical protein
VSVSKYADKRRFGRSIAASAVESRYVDVTCPLSTCSSKLIQEYLVSFACALGLRLYNEIMQAHSRR